jgi:hypothetical protein
MSDTPRTDAHYKQILDDALSLDYAETELRYWSEKLERELAAAIASFNEERERAQREGARVIELQVKLAEAVAAERERCAKVCDEMANSRYLLDDERQVAHSCAEAIRKGE